MANPEEVRAESDEAFDDLLVEFHERSDRGEIADPASFIAEHPEHREQLEKYFADVAVVEKLAGPPASSSVEQTLVTNDTQNASMDQTFLTGGTWQTSTPDTSQSKTLESFGRYQIMKELGRGAMGAVYLAKDEQLHREVALKIPQFDQNADPGMLERFYREARSAAVLQHPGICPVFDVGEIGGQHYITMAYIKGRPLRDFTKSAKRQEGKQVARVVRKIAMAMAEAHEHNVIHRDLKPANVMMNTKNEPVVMDFGLARCSTEGEERLTHTGTIIGTPAYMSPEQVSGDQDAVGAASDIYSLGVIFYELLTGQLPFQGNLMAILHQVATKDPTPPTELHGDVDLSLQDLCLRMLAKQPGDRPESMQQVADDLTAWLSGRRMTSDQTVEYQASDSSPPQTESQTSSSTQPLLETAVLPAIVTGQPETVASRRRRPSRVASPPVGGRSAPIAPWKNPKALLAGLGGAVILLAGIVFILTLGGKYDVQITLNDPSITLSVDGETLRINDGSDVIKLSAGEHQLQLEKDGLKTHVEEFTVTKDGKTALTAKVVNGQLDALLNGEMTPQIAARSPSETSQTKKAAWQGLPADAPPPAIAPFDANQAKAHQAAWADYLGEPVVTTNSIDMKLAVIPPGSFKMGERDNVVDVTLTKPFRLGVHEVTQGQWKAVMDGAELWKGHENIIEGENVPATFVQWKDAEEFCRRLTEREHAAGTLRDGWEYRLPTEAEWEWACRAGTTTEFSFGADETWLEEYGWFDSNARSGEEAYAHEVGLKKPNPWGFYDMHGNVWEWCQDWNSENQELPGGTDPVGPNEGSLRVVRSGSWGHSARDSRSAYHHSWPPSSKYYYLGFRLALSPVANLPGDQVDSSTPNFGLAFDGVDDMVEISDLPVDASGPLTIECFITPQDPEGTASIVRLYGSPGCSLYEIRGRIGCSRFDGDGQHTQSVADVDIDGRIHVAATWQGKEMSLFINGRRVGQPNQLPQGADRSVGRLFLGGQLDTRSETRPNFLWKGVLDEVRISNVVRYDADFKPTERHPSDEHTIALYHFDEGQGEVLTDSSGNGHHGKIAGAKWVRATGAPHLRSPPNEGDNFALRFAPPSEGEPATNVRVPTLKDKTASITIELWLSGPNFEGNFVEPKGWIIGFNDTNRIEGSPLSSILYAYRSGENASDAVVVKDHVPGIKTKTSMHLAAVRDASKKELRIFLDGELIARRAYNELSHGRRERSLSIGSPDSRYGVTIQGWMDEVRLSSVARYETNFTPTKRFEADAHTLALYHFDEGHGDVLKDSSGNGHHGMITGAKWVRVRSSEEAAGDWRPLFDGRSLTGWEVEGPIPDCWKVEDGILVAHGSKSRLIYTAETFDDVVVRAECRLSDKGNSGLVLRAPRNGDELSGYEAQLAFADSPGTGTSRYLTGGIWNLAENRTTKTRPGEWFELEFEARGKRMRVSVDGERTAAVVDGAARNTTGHVALALFDTETRVEFRRIEVRVPRPPPAVAPFDAGKTTMTDAPSLAEMVTSDEWEWTEPVRLDDITLTSTYEADPCLSADGLSLYFASYRPGGYGENDLWVSTRSTVDSPWSAPAPMTHGLNTASHEEAPAIAWDSRTLVFASDRLGKEAGLFFSTRSSRDARWETPVPFSHNGKYYTSHPFLTLGGRALYFNIGNTIFVSRRENAQTPWRSPVKLSTAVNASSTDSEPWVSEDELVLLFCRNETGDGASADLYMATRPSRDVDWGSPTKVPVNSPVSDRSPHFCGADRTLYFSSSRGLGKGKRALWKSTLVAKGASGSSPDTPVPQTLQDSPQ